MAEVDGMAKFFEQIGHPGPAEGCLEGNGDFGIQTGQPVAHGVFVVVFEPCPFDRKYLAVRHLFH